MIRGETYKYQLANTPRSGVPRYSNCHVATWGLWVRGSTRKRRRKREIYWAKRDLVNIHSETSRLYDLNAGSPLEGPQIALLQILTDGNTFTAMDGNFFMFNDRDLPNLGIVLPLVLIVCESRKGIILLLDLNSFEGIEKCLRYRRHNYTITVNKRINLFHHRVLK